MSPIPSVATAVTLSTVAPSVTLDLDPVGQSATVMSQHLRTGGVLFAAVALVSVASYFYHGRGAVKNSHTSNTWVSLTGLLSFIRHRGSATTSTGAATNWPVDLEAGLEQHVSMVYARFFHPMFWNLVECHPATASTPAIYVEDEARENPEPDPNPPGVNSFLHMDDDDDDDDDWLDGNDNGKRAREKPDGVGNHRVEELPPYDTSSPTSVNFSSEIIGTTARQGGFLSVPGELEDDSSESSPSESKLDFPGSPYDGILTTDSESDFSCSPYDGIVTSPPRSSSSTRRYGVADMASFAQSLKDTIPEEGYNIVPAISRRTGLLNISNFVETDSTLSCRPLRRLGPMDEEPAISDCYIGIHDSRDVLGDNPTDANTPAVPHEGVELMWKLLAALRDPNMDCTPRELSEDRDSEYSDDDGEGGTSIPRTAPPWLLHKTRRDSLKSALSPGTDSEFSDEGSIYPLTPPSKPTTSFASSLDVHKDRMTSPVIGRFNEEALVMSPTSLDSPPAFPIKAHLRSRRDSRSLLYGPRVPLASLPRL